MRLQGNLLKLELKKKNHKGTFGKEKGNFFTHIYL